MNVTRIFKRRDEVKRRNLIALFAAIALVLVLVLTGCPAATPTPSATATATPTSTPSATSTPQVVTVEVEKSYKCLNPQGIFIPVETSALSPRLDTLNGKTIYIIQGEADPVIMPALSKMANEEYPNTTWVYYNPVSSFGSSSIPAEVVAAADGLIRGIGW